MNPNKTAIHPTKFYKLLRGDGRAKSGTGIEKGVMNLRNRGSALRCPLPLGEGASFEPSRELRASRNRRFEGMSMQEGPMSVEELFRGWRKKHPDLSYGEKRWWRPGEYVSEQVPYGEIMDSISEHVVEVEGKYDPYKVRGIFETAQVECSRRVS